MEKLKILVVDDEVLRRDSIRNTIVSVNKDDTIDEASTYPVALAKIKDIQYNVILLDHDLADIHYKNFMDGRPSFEGTGYELAKEIKNSINKNTTVVVISLNPVGTGNIVSVLPGTSMICPVYLIPKQWEIIRRTVYEREASKMVKKKSLQRPEFKAGEELQEGR